MKRNAFTLVELSIVLVITGFVVGGVLVGRELVRASELRSVMSDIEKIQSGTIAFDTKYSCLPGDCPTAITFFGGTATNGDGNRKIGTFPLSATYGEVWQYWYQLSQAGLFPGVYAGTGTSRIAIPGTNVPATKMGVKTGYTVVYWNGYTDGNDWNGAPGATVFSHNIMVGTPHTVNETYAPGFLPVDASSIDTKMDDGLPGKGNIITSSPIIFPSCVTSATPSSSTYNITNSTVACGLMVFNKF